MLLTTGRDDQSVKYAYCEEIKSLVSYLVKKKRGWKNVLVLNSMHRYVSVTNDARKKPDVIVFYDHTKGGVDVMDQMAGCFTTRFKSHRWIMNALSYVLDTVRTNMNTPWNEMNPDKKVSMIFSGNWDKVPSRPTSNILTKTVMASKQTS